MEYNHAAIESKWQHYWKENKIYKTQINQDKPKYYVLDMFPYPSGAGLHVGHPLGYIASDIFSRFKRLKGFNVLHPMGYDAYGLPAEQYAIQTGQHPALTTEQNIKRYREQLDKIGFSYDWDREIRTSDPKYYKWTQWTFIKLFHSWYNRNTNKAEPIENLIKYFELNGSVGLNAASDKHVDFTSSQWEAFSEEEKSQMLMNYRLAYLADTWVNWCPALGTVLANDEVKDGVSERGGHPVEKKLMKQWSLRISAYAQRLLEGLDKLEWSDSIKEVQRNWIGRSEGATAYFKIKDTSHALEIFTTRPDTIFGATFMVLAPEHELIDAISTTEYREKVSAYVKEAKNRSERERQAKVKNVSGQFTGAYAINPLNNKEIPIWVADYVLMGYGSGAIMAVPAHDSRDFVFAQYFNLPIIQVVNNPDVPEIPVEQWENSYDAKDGIMINSDFINGITVKEAIKAVNSKLESLGIGFSTVNYRLRDAIFSRQRYWGEPFPVYYKNNVPYTLSEDQLPLLLPEIDKYLPTESGEPPLARAKHWQTSEGYRLEYNTMPGFAGSSAYYLRYMDPHNDTRYFSREAVDYWKNVDLYLGGDEHATGHLIYARFWNKFLFDLGMVVEDEPFKKLINQGKIQGRSSFVYRVKGENTFVSYNLRKNYDVSELHVDISLVHNDILDLEAFKNWRTEYKEAQFILEGGKYICGWEIEKMSKSKYNVQNPDDLIEKYGSDTFRMYEMFLGPIEQHKPWDTNGIEGVYRFLKKFWKLFHPKDVFELSDDEANPSELKVLHRTIKKIQEDIERFSFNTSVSAFMVCVNELTDLQCNKRKILEPLLIVISPFAPHIAEELWHQCGNTNSVVGSVFPEFNSAYLAEENFDYPVSFNGKMRFLLTLSRNLSNEQIEEAVLKDERSAKWLEGKTPKKIIIVPNKIINIVI